MATKPQRLIVVVTGANSGIGYGACCRLIEQLLHFNPPDASLLYSPSGIPNVISPYAGTTELTIIVACRNPVYGEETRERLLKHAKDAAQRQQVKADDNGHSKKFLKGLEVDYLNLDLNSIDSIFSFAVEASQRYPYISHLIFNAGALNMERTDYIRYTKQLLAEGFIRTVTYPIHTVQRYSAINKDGFGDTWQINTFGHYCLFRRLEPLLRACPFEEARIEWTSSLDGFKHSFNPNDIQLLNTAEPYQPSKYQVNLVCAALARLEEKSEPKEGEAKLTHVSIHPGICSTNNTATALNAFMNLAKRFGFYMARWLGSPDHPVEPFKGALSGTFAALTSKQVLDQIVWNPPRLIGTRATFWGKEYVGLDPWELEKHEADLLEKYVEDCYSGLPQVTRSS